MSHLPPPPPPYGGPPGPPYGWGAPPAYVRPPKPELPLRRPLIWTAVFSSLGLLAGVAAIALAALMVYAFIWFIFSMVDNTWSFWGVLGEAAPELVLGALGVVLVLAVVSFALCTGVLLLLRLNRSVRTWAAPLQGLLAAGVVYVGGTVVVTFVGALADAIGSS